MHLREKYEMHGFLFFNLIYDCDALNTYFDEFCFPRIEL